jgi:hypothetical protein
MAKSVLTRMAVCAALMAFAGNASAHIHKSRHHMTVHMTKTAPTLALLTSKGGPLHDCVHVPFPQCDTHGSDQPND